MASGKRRTTPVLGSVSTNLDSETAGDKAIDHRRFYQALVARDARFDGVFFVGDRKSVV